MMGMFKIVRYLYQISKEALVLGRTQQSSGFFFYLFFLIFCINSACYSALLYAQTLLCLHRLQNFKGCQCCLQFLSSVYLDLKPDSENRLKSTCVTKLHFTDLKLYFSIIMEEEGEGSLEFYEHIYSSSQSKQQLQAVIMPNNFRCVCIMFIAQLLHPMYVHGL